MAAACQGRAEALTEIYDTTFTRVFAYAFRIAGNRQDAEDITSETYERALRSLGQIGRAHV